MGAFEAGDGAWGMRHLRPGTGRTEHDDRLFALGYPYMLLPTDERVKWDKLQTVIDVLNKHPRDLGELPRELLPWLVRRWPNNRRTRWKEPADADVPDPDLDALLAEPRPVANHKQLVWAIEAVHGSRFAAEHTVAAIESWEDLSAHHPGRAGMVRALYFVLLRVGEATHDALHARLATVFARQERSSSTLQTLDMLLHGREGVERSGYRPDRVQLGEYDLAFARDDPEWVGALGDRVSLYAMWTSDERSEWTDGTLFVYPEGSLPERD